MAAPLLLLGLSLGVPAWGFLIALLHPRAGFNWHYLAPSVPAFALLIGLAMDTRKRERLVGSALAFVGLCALVVVTKLRDTIRRILVFLQFSGKS